MTFNDNVQLDTSTTSGGRGGGGGMMVGGGIGGIILLILSMVFGVNLTGMGGGGGTSSGAQGQSDEQKSYQDQIRERCQTGADANKYVECRIVGTENSAHAFWSQVFQQNNLDYKRPSLNIFQRATGTGCGQASSQTGPFYCPMDQGIYVDASFFDVLTQQFGSSQGALAQEYVIAHEYGHHIQNMLGFLQRAQQDPQGAESGAVRLELQADCYAGVWANHASTTPGPGGQPYLKQLTREDINDALSAAASVGDDRIQQKTQGRTNPETYTHGTSEQRQKWFIQGYNTGNPGQCDTFRASDLG